MIEVYLDGALLEVPQDLSIGLSLGVADYNDPITASGAYTQTLQIPRTPHNDLAFNLVGEIMSAEQYNNEEHSARVLQDGCELVGGKAYLESVSTSYYNIQIVGEEIGWVAKIREKRLSELEGEYIGDYMPTDWAEVDKEDAEQLPKLSWVLLEHGCWFQEADGEKIRRSWATYQDLIPIVKLQTLLEHIFSGYEIDESSNLRELLNRTYSTIKWAISEEATILEEDYNFELTSNMLNADSNGELKATIENGSDVARLRVFDTIVESKSDEVGGYTDSEGVQVEFSPKETRTMSFELKTKYRTDVGFYVDEAYLDKSGETYDVAVGEEFFVDQLLDDDDIPYLQLSYTDSEEWRNKELVEDGITDYKKMEVAITNQADFVSKVKLGDFVTFYFEVDDPSKYNAVGCACAFEWERVANSQDFWGVNVFRPTMVGNITERFIAPSNQYSGEVVEKGIRYRAWYEPALRGNDGKWYSPYSRNYYMKRDDGIRIYMLSSDNTLTFNVAMRTPAVRYEPKGAIEIGHINLACSRFGNQPINVYGSGGGSLKPVFDWLVPIRERVRLSDLGGDTTADSVLRSIMQLYNLRVVSNAKSKRVRISTEKEFFDSNIVDWTNRVDEDGDISIEYLGNTNGKEVILSYADGSARIDYYNERHKVPYFAYKKALPNKMSAEEKIVQNEIFTPPFLVKVEEAFGNGSGLIPAVASKDNEGDVLEFNLNDVPNTLVVIGTEESTPRLPLNASVFGDIGNICPPCEATYRDYTLSFADKDEAVGLHQFYTKQIRLWERGKRMTCYCRVEPWEIEEMRYDGENINFRSLYHLTLKGEDIYARLESIEYEPGNTTNKCTFIIE